MPKKSRAAVKAFNREVFDFFVADAMRSRQLKRLTAEVVSAQAALRRVSGKEAWNAYLDLEKLTNLRVEKQLRRLFRRMLVVRCQP